MSVVIPNYNGESTLGDQLQALSEQTYQRDWEIVVADNGSTDKSLEVLEKWARRMPNLRWVDASDRQGFSYASNAAAWAAKGDFLVFCDNDDIVDANWIEAMVESMSAGDIIGGWLDDTMLNDPITRSWRSPLPRDELPLGLGFRPFVVAGNLGARAQVFQDLGGWNEEYVHGAQDVEFSWRATLAGYELGFARDAIVHYRYRSGLAALLRQHRSWGIEEAHLFKDFRAHGFPRSSTKTALIEWAWLVVHALDLRGTPERRGSWARKAGRRVGRLQGSVRHRVLFL